MRNMTCAVLVTAAAFSLGVLAPSAVAVATPDSVESGYTVQTHSTWADGGDMVVMCDSYCVGAPDSANPLELLRFVGTCAQMPYQFSTQVGKETGLTPKNVACAGATIDEVRTGKNGQPSQLDALSPQTKLVVIRIGGNNVGLTPSGVCIVAEIECRRDSLLIKRAYGEIGQGFGIASLADSLDRLYADVKDRIQPGTTVIALGYPPVVSGHAGISEEPLCQLFVSPSERGVIVDLQGSLNGEVRGAAMRAGFTYVDPWEVSSPFMRSDPYGRGLDACSTSPQKAISLADLSTSPLHPTKAGVDYDSELLLQALAS